MKILNLIKININELYNVQYKRTGTELKRKIAVAVLLQTHVSGNLPFFRLNSHFSASGALLRPEYKNVHSAMENLDHFLHFDTLVEHVRPRKKMLGHFEVGVKIEKYDYFF